MELKDSYTEKVKRYLIGLDTIEETTRAEAAYFKFLHSQLFDSIKQIDQSDRIIDMEQIVEYLKGKIDIILPDNIKDIVDMMVLTRKTAIAREMQIASDEARKKNIIIGDTFLSGDEIDPNLDEEVYNVSNRFYVYDVFDFSTITELKKSITPPQKNVISLSSIANEIQNNRQVDM